MQLLPPQIQYDWLFSFKAVSMTPIHGKEECHHVKQKTHCPQDNIRGFKIKRNHVRMLLFFPAPLITIKTTIIIMIIMFLGNQHHRHLREALEEVELFPWPTPWRPCRDRRARRRGGSATLEVEDIHQCYLKC